MHWLLRGTLLAGFTTLGMAGLVMPVLPGWIFLAAAVAIVFPNAKLTRDAVAALERRVPATKRWTRLLGPRAD